MKIVIQRVLEASVKIDGNLHGQIGKGYLLLIGISNDDTKEIADKMLEKTAKLRIFEDENGKTNLSIADVCKTSILPPCLTPSISKPIVPINCSNGVAFSVVALTVILYSFLSFFSPNFAVMSPSTTSAISLLHQ